MSLLGRVVGVLEEHGVEYALIGGIALAHRGHPRYTLDTDLFTTESRVLRDEMWTTLADVKIDIRRGDSDDPLKGVVRLGDGEQVDVVVGKWNWEHRVIQRSEPMNVEGVVVPVPTRADLILLKLAAGGPKDLIDARELLRLGPRDEIIAHVNENISSLPSDAQQAWERLLVP